MNAVALRLVYALDAYREQLHRSTRFLWLALTVLVTSSIIIALPSLGVDLQLALAMLFVPIVMSSYMYRFIGGLTAAAVTGTALVTVISRPPSLAHQMTAGEQLGFLVAYLLLGITSGGLVTLAKAWRREADNFHSSALRTFAALVQTYDTQTGAHCERVASNACVLGKELGLSGKELNRLYWAGILHDVGKVVLPKEVLNKPAKLSDSEMDLIREHPGVGSRLLTGISEEFAQVADGVGCHHERWDGSGYPEGLKGEEIPLFGRILAVVDTFEAVTSDRPYQTASTPGAALEVLRNGAGTQFEPRLVSLYERLYWQGRLSIAKPQDKDDAFPDRESLWNVTNPGRNSALPGSHRFRSRF